MTVRFDDSVARVNGRRYHVLMEGDSATRAWVQRHSPSQMETDVPFELPLESFHEGCGFTFDDVSFVYEYAHQFDATRPGTVRTWALDTTTISTWSVANDEKGWMEVIGGYLYAIGSNIAKKFDPSDWSVDDTEDFAGGDNRVVCGRPGRLNDRLYLPIRDTDDDSLEVFQELTTIATAPTADTWTAGPAGREARGFISAQQDRQGKMWRICDTEHQIASVATAPTTTGNWSDANGSGYEVGSPGERVTDLAVYDRYIVTPMSNGLHSLDETLYYVNRIPGIAHFFDNSNGLGTESWQDRQGACIVMPHRMGDFRWSPESTRPVGPAQEGGLETRYSPDVQGDTLGQLQVFPWLYQFKEDRQNSDGFVTALHPGYGRRQTPSHCFFKVEAGRYDAGAAVYVEADDDLYLAIQYANTAGTTRGVHLAKLPRGTIHPSGDERVDHAVSGATFSTVRYTQGNRDIQKAWQKVELHATLSPTTNTPGLEVWASVDEGAAFQLQDGAGAAKTVLTSGRHEFFFPSTSASVGRWVRLEFRVPALTGEEDPVDVTIRNVRLHGFFDPEMVRVSNVTFVLGPGEFADGGSMRYSTEDQRDALEALSQPKAAPVLINDPWGGEYYGKIEELAIREAVYKGYTHPLLVAVCRIRETPYE